MHVSENKTAPGPCTAAASPLPADLPSAKGYVDLQVNGYAGVDFNGDELTPEDLLRACRGLRSDGVACCLATVITAPAEIMARRLARLVDYREQHALIRSVIQGLHIEGPALSPEGGYRGAHNPAAIRPAEVDLLLPLLEAGGGLVRLVTLAPENDSGMRTVRRLVQEGCLVAAGHTDASLDDLKAAIDAGLTLFTHLGNGCPTLLPRHDNIIQRALFLRDRLTLCFIADGIHVPYFALANYLALADPGRAIVVTDAVAAAGLGPGRYTLGSLEVEVGEDLATWAPDRSHLVGSAMTMPQSHANLRRHLGLDEDTIRQLTRTNPARLLDGSSARAPQTSPS